MDKNMFTISVMIDLRKAFDTCDHDVLLLKLKHMGIGDDLLQWFSNYLSNRKQRTVVNGVLSSIENMTIGVPQGALLGVLLFQIQINNLRKCLKFTQCILYADDTTIYLIGNNLRFLCTKVQYDLDAIFDWLNANKLCLNVSKTKALLFTRQLHHADLSLTIDSKKIEFVNEFKFLGVWLDTKLNFNCHAEHVYSKLLKNIYLCRKMSCISTQAMSQIFVFWSYT